MKLILGGDPNLYGARRIPQHDPLRYQATTLNYEQQLCSSSKVGGIYVFQNRQMTKKISCLYAAFNILTGEVIGKVTSRHRAKEFLEFMGQIERSTPKDLDLHVILDNGSTHKTPDVKKWLAKHPRIILHFTPTSASWLNAVESWFAQLERRAVYRNAFSSVKELENEIYRYIKVHNTACAKPFKWTKPANAILESVQRARESINVNRKN